MKEGILIEKGLEIIVIIYYSSKVAKNIVIIVIK